MGRRIAVVILLVVVVAVGTLLLLRGREPDRGEGSDAVARSEATGEMPDAASLRGTPAAELPSAPSSPDGGDGADPQPTEAHPVRGVVLDGQGEPQVGAHVYLLPKGIPGWSDEEANTRLLPRTRTGEDGRFDLGVRATTGTWVGVLADGHLPRHLDGDGVGEDVEVRLETGPLVHVTVVGPDDGPLDLDTSILIEPADEAWAWPGPDGVWAFRQEAGVAERTREAWVPVATQGPVIVDADYRSVNPIVEPDEVTVTPPDDVTFRIFPSCVLDIRVLDAASEQPLASGFHYWLLLDGVFQTGGSTSLPGGAMRVAYRLPPAAYTVQVGAIGYRKQTARVVGLERYGDHATVEVSLERDASLGSLRVSIPVLATLPKIAGPEGGEHAPPAYFLWKRSRAMATSYVQLMLPGELPDWGSLAGRGRRESDTDHLFEAVPAGETVLLVAEWQSRQVAVLAGVTIRAGKTNAVVAALEPGIVFPVQALDVEGAKIEELTVRHPVHGELPTYWVRAGASTWDDPGGEPDPAWTLGPYPGPEIEVETVDDQGRTRTHRLRLDDER